VDRVQQHALDGDLMKKATTQGLYQYWNAVRGNRLAPRRYEVEPSQIVPFLSNTIILEQPDNTGCRIRVAGTNVCELLGDDLRGQLFLEHWDDDDQHVLLDSLKTITRYGGVGLFEFNGEFREDSPVAKFELLLLPLLHLESRIERVLGSISAIAEPDWLAGSYPCRLRLTSNKIIWPDGRHRGLARDSQPVPFQAERPGNVPVLRSDAGIRRARLVRSERRQFLVYDGGLSSNNGADIGSVGDD
jgi:hypothetical protein